MAYMLATFPLAYVWHLVLFEGVYERLGYFTRAEPIVALGFLVIMLQGGLLSFLYPRFDRGRGPLRDGLNFGMLMGLFLWSSQVVAAAAKQAISPLPIWLAIETAYFLIQFALAGVAIGFVHHLASTRSPRTSREVAGAVR